MKSAESKSAAVPTQKKAPFFSKDTKRNFFGDSEQESFFPKDTATIQTQLAIGHPDDRYEKEADAVADKVVQRLAAPEVQAKRKPVAESQPLAISPLIQHKSNPLKEEVEDKEDEEIVQESPAEFQPKVHGDANAESPPEEENKIRQRSIPGESAAPLQKKSEEPHTERLQREPIISGNENMDPVNGPHDYPALKKHGIQRKGDASTESAPAGIEQTLNRSKGNGAPIPDAPRQQMESSFGSDFSDVRVHTDSAAAQMNKSLGAHAFTHGKDVYFNSGKYNNDSPDGRKLLAHELTHTVQQDKGIQRKAAPAGTKAGEKEAPTAAPTSSEVVDISSGQFSPSEIVKAEIEKTGAKGLDVRVIVPNISEEGKIKIRLDSRGNYQAVQGQKGYMPVVNAWAKEMGGLYLRFTVKNSTVTGGFVSPIIKGGNPNDWIKKIKENTALLGGIGLKVGKLPNPVNEFNGNSFRIGFTEGNVEVGGILDAKFNFSLENGAKPKIDGTADVNVKGVAKGQLKLDNTKEKLTGEVSLAVEFKDFTGNVTVRYNEDGSIDIHGKGAYNANKLSGEIDFVSTDLQSANNFAKDAIKAAGGKENVQNATPPAAPPVPQEGKKDRALAAVGQLQFHLTEWFAGTVNVIVDGKGDVTVIGRIAPPAEVELFKQKDYDQEIIGLQVEAGYGIPVVGTIGVFAGVSLSAVAYIGPAKLYNIEILGTYSTDPEVQKSIQIAASINISAYAGLRLRAEGGAKLTVVSHDLKLGVGINADVGVKAYADARPTIGYREPGEFYISGTAEMIAQPMLGLSGDFFIELDTPWWSPLDDDRWVWPIGSKEWPLSDPIGLSATMKEYVLGSGTAPEIEFKEPEFDPSKFMTKMVDKELPDKTGATKGGGGQFKEDGSIVKPDVPDPNAQPAEPLTEGKPGKEPAKFKEKKKKKEPDAKAQQEAALLFKNGAEKLQNIKGPISKGDLRKQLDIIEKSVPGIKYHVRLDGNNWKVTGSAKGIDNPKAFKVSAIITEEDKKAEAQEAKADTITAALHEIDVVGKKESDEGEITAREAEAIKDKVNADHPTVIRISSVRDAGLNWDFEYVQLAMEKSLPKRTEGPEGTEWLEFKEKFSTETGISHTIYLRDTKDGTELIIESAPMTVLSFFNQNELEIKHSTTLEEEEKTGKLNRIRHGKNLLQGLEAMMNSNKLTTSNPLTNQKLQRIPGMIREIILVVREIEPGGVPLVVPRAEFSPGFSNAKAFSFSARYLYKGGTGPGGRTIPKNHAVGGPPSESNLVDAWQILRDMQLSRRWVKFHILNEKLGGVAADSNLIPTPSYFNNEYRAELEDDLKRYYRSGLPIWIQATITYRSGYNTLFVNSFSAQAGAMKYETDHWIEDPTKQLKFSKEVDMPQSNAFNINSVINDASLETLLVNMSTMSRAMVTILRARQPSGGYRYYRQMERALASEVFGRDVLSFDPEVIIAQSPSTQQDSKINAYRAGLSSVNWSY